MNLKLGTWMGVPLYVNWSCYILLLISFIFAGKVGLAFTIFGLFFVVLHEYGHIWMAQSFGWNVSDVTIYLIGGIARMQIRCNPKEEICVAAAGPAVSFLLFLVFAGLAFILPPIAAFVSVLCALANLVLLLYNLLPVLPMDGGRVLRATLFLLTDYATATWWTVRVGEVCGIGFAILAFYIGAYGVGVITLLMVGVSHIELERANQLSVLLDTRKTVAATLNSPELNNATIEQLVIALESMDEQELKRLKLDESLDSLRQYEHLSI